MTTKLQELLEELKGLKKWDILEGDEDMDFDIIERPAGEFIKSGEILQLITKYTETTASYKPGDNVRTITKSNIFDKGERIILTQFDEEHKSWLCVKGGNKEWLYQEDFEPIN